MTYSGLHDIVDLVTITRLLWHDHPSATSGWNSVASPELNAFVFLHSITKT